MFSYKRLISILIVVVVVIIILVIACTQNLNEENEQKVQVTATPVITATTTPEVTAFPTKKIIFVIEVTPVPTSTPNVTATPTVAPTLQPTATATSVPTIEPTLEPTLEPTIEPTLEPTVAPTLIPTATPTFTPVPTQDTEKEYIRLESELSTLVMAEGIYLDYDSNATYDLYNYINVTDMDSQRLFNYLKVPFEDAISRWVGMNFDYQGDCVDKLSYALEASICDKCGRVVIGDYLYNKNQICSAFGEIELAGEYAKANEILLNYLYNYTVKNLNNPNERLFIVCDCK